MRGFLLEGAQGTLRIGELSDQVALFLQKTTQNLSLAVVVIDKEAEGIETMRNMLVDELALPFPALADKYNIVARRYGAEELPFLTLIDSAGRIRWFQSGFREGSMKALETEIEKVLDEAKPGEQSGGESGETPPPAEKP